MREDLARFSNWTFQIDEVSAGVYRLVAKHSLGCSIDQTGNDPVELLEQAKKSAEAMERELKKIASRRTGSP